MSNAAQAITSHTPLYLQIAETLRARISSGEITSGAALPSERHLCALTGASRVTVRKAIDELIAEGLLFRRQGSGTFVAKRIEAPNSHLSGFSDDTRGRGEEPGAIWIANNYATPSALEAQILNVSTATQVARLGRIRLSDNEPLAIEHAIVPAALLPSLEEIGDSLYRALDSCGNRPVKGTQKIRACLATPTEAAMLSVSEKSPILRIERVTRKSDDTVVEYTRSAYRGDKYDFVSSLI